MPSNLDSYINTAKKVIVAGNCVGIDCSNCPLSKRNGYKKSCDKNDQNEFSSIQAMIENMKIWLALHSIEGILKELKIK